MEALSELIRNVNIYLSKRPADPQPLLLTKGAAYVSRILSVFGLIDAPADRWAHRPSLPSGWRGLCRLVIPAPAPPQGRAVAGLGSAWPGQCFFS
jgi:hypothetical protein